MFDVHTRHCCKNCGCKYGEDSPEENPFDIGCSVVSGRREQERPCGEQDVCGWEYEDE